MRLNVRLRRFFVAFAGAAALAVCSMPAQATTVLFNSLSGSIAGADSISADGPLGESFSTGSTPITLTDVKVSLYLFSGAPDPTVSLLSNSDPSPGTLISTLGSINVYATSPTVYDFSGFSVPLAANTRYWIELSSSTTGVLWNWTYDTTGTGVSDQYYYYNSATSASPMRPYLMEVSGVTAVPEPPVLPLVALGFLAMAFLGRRRFAC